MGWHYAALEDRFRRISGVNGALAILDWDTAVVMPRKAAGERGEQFAVLKRIAHEMLTHAETGEQLAAAEQEADLDKLAGPPTCARCGAGTGTPTRSSRLWWRRWRAPPPAARCSGARLRQGRLRPAGARAPPKSSDSRARRRPSPVPPSGCRLTTPCSTLTSPICATPTW